MAGPRPGSGEPTPTNRVHFACFACRKGFKQRGSSDWDSNVDARPYPCPECRAPMARLGPHFRAPRQRAVRAWRAVERLYQQGERFG